MSNRAFTPLEKKPTIKNRHSLTGFTLLEVIIALILASVLTIGSIKVIENMQRETNRFKQQVDDDMTWLTANHHLAKNVRGSSYLENPDGNTLILRNYDQTERGRYFYNSRLNRLEYQINSGATVQSYFQNVRATFSLKTTAKRNDKTIETIINYTLPFANVLYLRCAADVKPATSSTWASVYNSSLPGIRGFKAKATGDGKFIVLSNDGGIYKLDTDGKIIWCEKLIFSGATLWPYDICEAPGGGYVLACMKGSGVAAIVKLNTNGAVVWNKTVSAQVWPDSIITTSDGGYAIIGKKYIDATTQYIFAAKINSAGTVVWTRDIGNQFHPPPNGDTHAVQVFPRGISESMSKRVGGVSTGYILTGEEIGPSYVVTEPHPSGGTRTYDRGCQAYSFWIKLNPNTGAVIFNRSKGTLIGPAGLHRGGTYDEESSCSKTVYDVNGNEAGYLVGGAQKKIPPGLGPWEWRYYAYIMRTDISGNQQWVRYMPLVTTNNNGSTISYIQPTPDNGYIITEAIGFSGGYGRYSTRTMPHKFILRKYDPSLNETWLKNYDGGECPASAARFFMYKTIELFPDPAPDGGYILTGTETKFTKADTGTDGDRIFVIKTDANGDCPEALNPKRYPQAPGTVTVP